MELIDTELINNLFSLVTSSAVPLGLIFGIAQFLFYNFMRLAFPRKESV